MPDVATAADVASVPKVELHVHFGGSVDLTTAHALARQHGLEPGAVLENGRYPARYDGFPAFLRTLNAINGLIRTPDDVEFAAAAFARRQAEQNVIYSEVMVTALSHIQEGIASRDLWPALRIGFESVGPSSRVAIVVDAVRDFGPSQLEETFRALENADAPIVGVALTGVEDAWPTADFGFIRPEADRLGLGVEVHAGEMGPPASVAASLDVLGADRIGHGVAAARDPDLLARLVRDRVPVDVCPTSNVQIGLYPSLESHPVAQFWRDGVNMTISSDDPPIMGVSLTQELANVVRLARLTRHELAELQRRAARAAFLPVDEREALVARIDAWETRGR